MKNKKSGPRPKKKDHVGEGGRVFQEQGINPNAGKSKGHDLLESDSFTDGVGSAINSPPEAKRIDEERERADRET